MTQIYYKNPQQQFIKLTYKDFGAAAAYHTHTIDDIKATSVSNVYQTIPQIADTAQGGTATSVLSPTISAKILSSTLKTYDLSQITTNNGVLGYFDGATNPPSFQPWPIVAGGTGATSQEDAICQFGLGITNTATVVLQEQDNYWTFPLNNAHILDAHVTGEGDKEKTIIEFSIYLPFQLLPNTTGILELYPYIFNQPTTTPTSASYYVSYYTYTTTNNTTATGPSLEGFQAEFQTNSVVASQDVIYQYGFNSNTGLAGYVDPSTSHGNITIEAYGAGPVYEKNQLKYYQAGHILTVVMEFNEVINDNFKNNTSVILFLDQGLNNLTNQIKIRKPQN